MKKIITFCCFVLGSLFSQGQTRVTGGGSPALIIPIKEGVSSYVDGKASYMMNNMAIEGSPFLDDQWSKGIVSFRNGKVIDRVPLKLSLYDGQLYYNQNDVSNIFLDSIEEVKLLAADSSIGKNRIFRAEPFVLDKELANTFMEVLADGPVQLLKFAKMTVESYLDMNRAGHQRFKTIYEYYLAVDNGPVQKVKLSKEPVFKALGPYEQKAELLLQTDRSKLKSETSVADFITRLNQQDIKSPNKAF